MSNKLAIAQKVAIILSRERSLRKIAQEYGVHHSIIADIYQESEEILKQYWEEKSKRKGRPSPPKDVPTEELTKAAAETKELTKQLALKAMRIDWLELQLKWEHERALEEGRKARNQLKKKKKSNC